MPAIRGKFGNRGNYRRKAWEPHNLLKLKAGHRGNHGNRKKAVFINVCQTSAEKPSRNREIPRCPRCPRCPNHPFIIFYIINLYIYICLSVFRKSYFRSFGNRKGSFGNRKSVVGNRKTNQFPFSKSHFPGFHPLNFDRIGGNHGTV